MVRACLIVWLIGLHHFTIAQKQFSLGVGTGINILQSYDQAVSPLVYRGLGFPFAFRGTIEGEQWQHQLDLSVISSSLSNAYPIQSEAGSRLNSWHWFNAEYSLLYRIKQGQVLDHFIGGNFRSLLFYREYAHLDGYSWEALNGLYFSYAVAYHVNRHHFRASVLLPVIAYLHRPQYTADELFLEDLFKNQDILKYGHFSLPFQCFWQYRVNLTYSYDLTQRWKMEADINLEQYEVAFPRKSKNITFQALTHILYKF